MIPQVHHDDLQKHHGVCRPADQIGRLLRARLLPRYLAVSSPDFPRTEDGSRDHLGNCHEAALALMTDLILSRQANGWFWAEAKQSRWDWHSWLEHGAWALDCAEGKLLFMDRQRFREYADAWQIRRRDGAETKKWLIKLARHNTGGAGLPDGWS